jgi:hypothetical protein
VALIYKANRVEWKTGDYVIHDSDAKRADMLMVVIGRSRDGGFRTRYAFPSELPRSWPRRVWRNTIDPLHDPRRFGIDVPAMQSPPASSSTRATPAPPAPCPSATS